MRNDGPSGALQPMQADVAVEVVGLEAAPEALLQVGAFPAGGIGLEEFLFRGLRLLIE